MINSGYVGIQISNIDKFVLDTGTVYESQSHGIQVETANSSGIVKGMLVKNNSQSTGTVSSGIVIGSCTLGVIVTNNKCWDDQAVKMQKYGIITIGTSTGCIITNNDVRGNVESSIPTVGANIVEGHCLTTTMPFAGEINVCNDGKFLSVETESPLVPKLVWPMDKIEGHCADLKINVWACLNAPSRRNPSSYQIKD